MVSTPHILSEDAPVVREVDRALGKDGFVFAIRPCVRSVLEVEVDCVGMWCEAFETSPP